MTNVYFCKEEGPDGELAVFVDQMNGQKVPVYSHTGQHSEADVEYVKNLPPMENPEQSELYNELVGQGYDDIGVAKKFADPAATDTPVDECVEKMVESVIGGSPICESVKAMAHSLFEGVGPFDDVDDVYGKLLDNGYFTEEELQLATKGWGYNMDTLDTIVYVRFGEPSAESFVNGDGEEA